VADLEPLADEAFASGGAGRIGFDWVCFCGQSSFLAQKRRILGLFGADDDSAWGSGVPVGRIGFVWV
jgi:hypothetical protein